MSLSLSLSITLYRVLSCSYALCYVPILVQVQGNSYTLVNVNKLGRERMTAHGMLLSGKPTTITAYERYVKGLEEKDRQQIKKMEKFMSTRAKTDNRSVRVVQLEAGDQFSFAAREMLHSAIIPAQEKPRILAVFHQPLASSP